MKVTEMREGMKGKMKKKKKKRREWETLRQLFQPNNSRTSTSPGAMTMRLHRLTLKACGGGTAIFALCR